MGRRKIEIKFINDDRNRSVTFIKRKNGLFKKAHELSILTGAKVTVHVEDIKERQFDYISANLGGEVSHQQFHSDDDEDDAHSNDGQLEELHDADYHESASSVGSTTAPASSKRDSSVLRPAAGDRRSQSSLHLSPNPNVASSRRSSGHPYPRSPGTVPTTSTGLARPVSMDFGMSGYTHPAGGPQRKVSVPSMPLNPPYSHGQQQNIQQQMHFNPMPQQQPQPQQQQQSTSTQFYFHPNQSQPTFGSFDQQQQQQYVQQQMPRYNGNLFQTNGHPATNSHRHMPAYPSNLVPSAIRPHSGTLPSSKGFDPMYQDYSGALGEYLDDDMDQDFDALATQASTPGNYDFSTNPSLTNLNMTASPNVPVQNRNGLGLGMATDLSATYAAQYTSAAQQQSELQQQAAQRSGFYNNPSGAQSTPNLAWLSAQNQMSPQRRA